MSSITWFKIVKNACSLVKIKIRTAISLYFQNFLYTEGYSLTLSRPIVPARGWLAPGSITLHHSPMCKIVLNFISGLVADSSNPSSGASSSSYDKVPLSSSSLLSSSSSIRHHHHHCPLLIPYCSCSTVFFLNKRGHSMGV